MSEAHNNRFTIYSVKRKENRQGILQRYLRHCVCTCSFYITMRKCFGLPNLNISLKIAIIYFTAIVLASRILINECEKKRDREKNE